jgi:hypothetical protein
MIEIYDGPKQYYHTIKSGIDLKVGEIVQLAVENNKIVIDRSDGSVPLGYICRIFDDGRAYVEFQRSMLRTDMYEPSELYAINANLYVSNGLLTTRRIDNNRPAIAIVTKPPSPTDPNLGCLWF